MKQSTTISLDEKLLEAARQEAKSQRRTLSAQLEIWLEEKFAKADAAPKAKNRPATVG